MIRALDNEFPDFGKNQVLGWYPSARCVAMEHFHGWSTCGDGIFQWTIHV